MIDHSRLQIYLNTMAREMDALQQALALSDQKILTMPLVLRGVKYSLIVIAEVIAEICQHILAKEHKAAVSGFSETLDKACSFGILDDDLHRRLAPFLRLRNLLVHGYWKVDDTLLLNNLRSGIGDFAEFAASIKQRFVERPTTNWPEPEGSPCH